MLSDSCKHLNRELCVKKCKSTFGNTALILINLRNAAAQCPRFRNGNKISLSLALTLLLPFPYVFFLSPSPICIFVLSVFLFFSNPKYLKVFPSFCESGSSACVNLFKHRSLLWSYRHYYCVLVSSKSPC